MCSMGQGKNGDKDIIYLAKWLENPGKVSVDAVKRIVEKYPSFTMAKLALAIVCMEQEKAIPGTVWLSLPPFYRKVLLLWMEWKELNRLIDQYKAITSKEEIASEEKSEKKFDTGGTHSFLEWINYLQSKQGKAALLTSDPSDILRLKDLLRELSR